MVAVLPVREAYMKPRVVVRTQMLRWVLACLPEQVFLDWRRDPGRAHATWGWIDRVATIAIRTLVLAWVALAVCVSMVAGILALMAGIAALVWFECICRRNYGIDGLRFGRLCAKLGKQPGEMSRLGISFAQAELLDVLFDDARCAAMHAARLDASVPEVASLMHAAPVRRL